MFTGIVQALGEIVAREPRGGDVRLRVRTWGLDVSDVKVGDSICTNGCCLTVTDLIVTGSTDDGFWCDVSNESLSRTTLGELAVGTPVNLEKSLTPSSLMGGHIVFGHVDGVAEVLRREDDGRSVRFTLRAPQSLAKYIAPKGSVCVDGVSLTVNRVGEPEFDVNIIPQTLTETIFDSYRAGTRVNLEVDVVARYLERLLQAGQETVE